MRITEARIRSIVKEELQDVESRVSPRREGYQVHLTIDAPPGRNYMPIDLLGTGFGEWTSLGAPFFGEQHVVSTQTWPSEAEAEHWIEESGLWRHVKGLYSRGSIRYADYDVEPV